MPDGYQLSRLKAADVSILTERVAWWYPDIRVGMESPHLEPSFYFTQTSLDGENREDTALLPLVVSHYEAGIVALITYERNPLARTISSRLGVVAPEHRSAGLGLYGPILLEKIGRAIGAELAYYFATLKTRHQQVIAERMGYSLVGIVPGYDRDMVREGEVKRVYEAIYSKVLVDHSELAHPDIDTFYRSHPNSLERALRRLMAAEPWRGDVDLARRLTTWRRFA